MVIRKFDNVDLSSCLLGENDDYMSFNGREEFVAIFEQLLAGVNKEIVYFAADFDPQIFRSQLIARRIEKLLATNPVSSVRTLVHSSRNLILYGYRTIELLRQYMPKVQCRLRKYAPSDTERGFILVDRCGYLLLPNAQNYIGTACFNDATEVSKLCELFDERWQVSTEDPEMRQIYI